MNPNPETQETQAPAENTPDQVPPAVAAKQAATTGAVQNALDNSSGEKDNEKSSKNSTEANPNTMNANPEVNPEAQAGLDRETKLKAIFAQLEEAMQTSDTEKIAALRNDLVALGIPENEIPSAESGQEAIEAGLKIINLVRKLLALNPENLADWDEALNLVKEESALVAAFRLHALVLRTVAEKTLGLEAIKAEWANKSYEEQISYLSGKTEGLFNRINEVAANMPFNKLPYLALRGMKRGLGAAQALVSDRSLATIPTVDLMELIFTGALPTSEGAIRALEAMVSAVDLNAVASVAEKTAPVIGLIWGPKAGAGVKIGAKLLNLKDFTNRGYFEACRTLRAERRAVANVQLTEEAAAMNALGSAANNNNNFKQVA